MTTMRPATKRGEKALRVVANGSTYRLVAVMAGWMVLADGYALSAPKPYAQARADFAAVTSEASDSLRGL